MFQTKVYWGSGVLLAIATALVAYHTFPRRPPLQVRWAAQPQSDSPWLAFNSPQQVTGAHAEIMAALANVSHLKLTMVEVATPQQRRALQNRTVDTAIENCRHGDAALLTSEPIFRREYWLLARRGDPRFSRPSPDRPWVWPAQPLVVGFMSNPTIEAALAQLPQFQSRAYPDMHPLPSLIDGYLDLMVADQVWIIHALEVAEAPTPLVDKVQVVSGAISTEDQCFVVHRGHPTAATLVATLNRALGRLKQEGTLAKILEHWRISSAGQPLP